MNKNVLCIWMSFVVILATALIALSCSKLSSGLPPAPPSNPAEPTPGQSIPGETQPSPTPTDLPGLASSNPAMVDNSKLPITSIEKLHVAGSASPEIDIAKYRLIVDGLVNAPLSLTYQAIMRYPTVTEVVLLICPDFFADNAEWTGVPVTTILEEAGIKPQANQVTFYSGEYQITLPLEVARHEGVFLAHTVDGQILPKEHGYPLRLVVKGEYGSNWVKWVDHIEIQ